MIDVTLIDANVIDYCCEWKIESIFQWMISFGSKIICGPSRNQLSSQKRQELRLDCRFYTKSTNICIHRDKSSINAGGYLKLGTLIYSQEWYYLIDIRRADTHWVMPKMYTLGKKLCSASPSHNKITPIRELLFPAPMVSKTSHVLTTKGGRMTLIQ